MERKNNTVLVVLVAAVILIAVFASFGMPLFSNSNRGITLPTPAPSESVGPGDSQQVGQTQVEVTAETVQSVIAALDRLGSYSRTVTTTLEGTTTATARVWVDGGWTRTDLTGPTGRVTHTIVGEGTVWRWYDGDRTAASWSGDAASADVEGQHIPTYEDVLALDKADITSAGYENKNGVDCVYAQVFVPELNQTERYWVGSDTGLLIAAETAVEEAVVYSMTAATAEVPAPAGDWFTLPDGTILHTVGG